MTRIEDYALIGDLQTAALVHRGGSIDWCCFPRFDSGACFAALLGDHDNGRWLLAPAGEIAQSERRYRPGTLILETIHTTETGSVRVIDFMPPRGNDPDIVRIVEGIDGEVAMHSELIIRFDYGHIVPWVRKFDHTRVAIAGADGLVLRAPDVTHGEQMMTISEFTVRKGARIPFVLTWFPSHLIPPKAIDPEQALSDTTSYWAAWSGSSRRFDAYHDDIQQSLLVLKALTYQPTGGIVAAPTTSLPECIGGVRNWDYRYCWLRDAALTLVAMLNSGYKTEAKSWREWLVRAVAGDPGAVQIMYGIAGERRLTEFELPWLSGFEQSRPVRIGNLASTQLQLDIFGEVLDAAYQTMAQGVDGYEFAWTLLRHLLEWLEDGWRHADAGIWEMRGEHRHFTHSKVMAWVAFDRAVRMHDEFGLEGKVDRWRELRDEIKAEILERAWSEKKQSFAQSYDSDLLDANVLVMGRVDFLDPNDPRMIATVEALERELMVDGLLLRYRSEESRVDGLPPGEGVFLACSFWLVEVLARQGKRERATELFERLLALRNDVGLLAEEYDPVNGNQLGNFPQAFSHLSLVTAALALGEHRSIQDTEPEPIA